MWRKIVAVGMVAVAPGTTAAQRGMTMQDLLAPYEAKVKPADPNAPPSSSPPTINPRAVPTERLGDQGELLHRTWGCRPLTIYLRATDLYLKNDIEAARNLIGREDCVTYYPGDVVMIERQESGFACIRRQGSPDCYWTYFRDIKKAR